MVTSASPGDCAHGARYIVDPSEKVNWTAMMLARRGLTMTPIAAAAATTIGPSRSQDGRDAAGHGYIAHFYEPSPSRQEGSAFGLNHRPERSNTRRQGKRL